MRLPSSETPIECRRTTFWLRNCAVNSEFPFHCAISGVTPRRARLMSVTIRESEPVAPPSRSRGRGAPGQGPSVHRYISWGMRDGMYVATSSGAAAFAPAMS